MIKEFDNDAIISNGHKVSYREMLQRITLFGEQFPKASEADATKPVLERRKVLIVSENREGFLYAFFSIWLNRSIAIPVDAQSSVADLVYVLNDCRPDCVWASQSKTAVVGAALKEAGMDIPVCVVDEFERAALPEGIAPADIIYNPEHTAVLMYTSGTTGSPKGVMLSFRNLLSDTASILGEAHFYPKGRRSLILLPLHHILPLQTTVLSPIIAGVGVAISPSLTGTDIIRTLNEGKVGLMVAVPRVWQSLYDGIMEKVNASSISRAMYRLCARVGSTGFSRFVFRKIHNMMGGHLTVPVSGGAPLDPELWKGMHALGLDIHEGYGMTETSPVMAACPPGEAVCGSVGRPFSSCEVTIIDGEICVKGDIVMQGYYNRPEETAAVFDAEGRLHTGDLGYLDEQGLLHVTGRKKEIIVLSNGKNINPAELEAVLASDAERIKEVAVLDYDDTLQAIVCPNPAWAFGKSKVRMEEELRQDVIDVYNSKAASYKQIFGVYVYGGELPKTRIGKVQRFHLKSILESIRDESPEAVSDIKIEEPQTEEYKLVADYIKKHKGTDVKPFHNFITDLKLDSLDIVELQCFIEQTCGIQVSQDQLHSFSTVGALAEFISANKTKLSAQDINWKDLLSRNLDGYKVPTMGPLGWRALRLLRAFFRPYLKPTVVGLENVPSDGNFIMASNHQSYLDTLLLMEEFDKKMFNNMRFLTKEEHAPTAFVRFMARRHGVIVLKKNDMKESILQLGEALKLGRNLLIFPEGTRTDDGNLNEFRPTFAILSMALGVPVIPVCIDGSFDVLPKHHKIPSRKPVTVSFLPAVSPQKFNDECEMTEHIKSNIFVYLRVKTK